MNGTKTRHINDRQTHRTDQRINTCMAGDWHGMTKQINISNPDNNETLTEAPLFKPTVDAMNPELDGTCNDA